jgi:hypothetical protein
VLESVIFSSYPNNNDASALYIYLKIFPFEGRSIEDFMQSPKKTTPPTSITLPSPDLDDFSLAMFIDRSSTAEESENSSL